MMSEFDSDKSALLSELSEARSEFEEVVGPLTAEDMARSRRGSWTVSKVLNHVLHSERIYTQLISAFNGKASVMADASDVRTGGEGLAALAATRKSLLEAVGGVEEQDFYRLQTIGHEEYSVLSILENVISHDREHVEQIRKTLAEA
jgi:uncharacterized damage-inducible protein DinB